MDIDERIRTWAATHHGLITRAAWKGDADDDERTSRSFDRAIAAHLLVRVDRNVAALAGTEITPVRRVAAAVLSYGRPCLVSHVSAAMLWGAPVVGLDPVDLLVRDRPGGSTRSAIRLDRPRDLQRTHPASIYGLDVTAPLRTLVDVGAVDPDAVAPTLVWMLTQALVTMTSVAHAVKLHTRRGRPGVEPLRKAMAGLPLGRKPPDSVLESLAAELFTASGLQGWIFHPRVRGFELDFAFPTAKVNIEVDGWAWHRSPDAFERDRRRDAELAAEGWVVLRFTWRQVTRQPGWVAQTVRTTIARRSGST